jgi:hypothetical protein
LCAHTGESAQVWSITWCGWHRQRRLKWASLAWCWIWACAWTLEDGLLLVFARCFIVFLALVGYNFLISPHIDFLRLLVCLSIFAGLSYLHSFIVFQTIVSNFWLICCCIGGVSSSLFELLFCRCCSKRLAVHA